MDATAEVYVQGPVYTVRTCTVWRRQKSEVNFMQHQYVQRLNSL